jgi:GGDEF domain-containing protein
MSSDYVNNVNKLISSNSAICATIIQSNGNPVYAYPLSSKLITADKNGNPYLSVSSPMIKIFTYSLKTGNTTILAAVYLVKPNDIYDFTRISFLIVLATTLIALIGLVFISMSTNKDTEMSKPHKNSKISDPDNILEDLFDDVDDVDDGNNVNDSEIDFNKLLSSTDQETHPLDNIPILEDISKSEKSVVSDYSDPIEVFSTDTGFCHERDLATRLDNELSKAASAEYDLSLLLLQIEGLNHSDEQMKFICTTLRQIYDFNDLIFEYKKDAFAIIFLNKNLDDAMKIAEKIFSAEQSILLKNNISNKLGLGISTRSIRIIPSSRLILEAQQALDKSYEETELPIVAFKVDPEKYRQCFK